MNFAKYIKGIEEETNLNNYHNIEKWHEELKFLSEDKSDAKSLIRCIIKYIEFGIGFVSLITDYKKQNIICKKYFEGINDLISEDMHNIFVEEITQKIFEIIIEEDSKSWYIKSQLLILFNHCFSNVQKSIKQKAVEKLPDIYLFKMVDSISTYGDYDFQVLLVETVFRMYGKQIITERLKELIPESQEMSQSFADIDPKNFDDDVRVFLNILNKNSGRIFSIACIAVGLGKIDCINPMENTGHWVDINLKDMAITWYCTRASFHDSNILSNEDCEWVLLTLFMSDVEKYEIHRNEHGSHILVYFELKSPCLSTYEDIQHIINKALKLMLVLEDNDISNEFINRILPKFPGNNSKSTKKEINKVSKNAKVYQPLNVKVSKIKSILNTSSVTALFDITASKSDTNSSLHPSKHQGSSIKTDVFSVHSSLSSDFLNSHDNDIQILSGRCTKLYTNSTLENDQKVSTFNGITQKVSKYFYNQAKDSSSDNYYSPSPISRHNELCELTIVSSDESNYETAEMPIVNKDDVTSIPVSENVNVKENVPNVNSLPTEDRQNNNSNELQNIKRDEIVVNKISVEKNVLKVSSLKSNEVENMGSTEDRQVLIELNNTRKSKQMKCSKLTKRNEIQNIKAAEISATNTISSERNVNLIPNSPECENINVKENVPNVNSRKSNEVKNMVRTEERQILSELNNSRNPEQMHCSKLTKISKPFTNKNYKFVKELSDHNYNTRITRRTKKIGTTEISVNYEKVSEEKPQKKGNRQKNKIPESKSENRKKIIREQTIRVNNEDDRNVNLVNNKQTDIEDSKMNTEKPVETNKITLNIENEEEKLPTKSHFNGNKKSSEDTNITQNNENKRIKRNKVGVKTENKPALRKKVSLQKENSVVSSKTPIEPLNYIDNEDNNVDGDLNTNRTEQTCALNADSDKLSEIVVEKTEKLQENRETLTNTEIDIMISEDIEQFDTLVNDLQNIKENLENKTEILNKSRESVIRTKMVRKRKCHRIISSEKSDTDEIHIDKCITKNEEIITKKQVSVTTNINNTTNTITNQRELMVILEKNINDFPKNESKTESDQIDINNHLLRSKSDSSFYSEKLFDNLVKTTITNKIITPRDVNTPTNESICKIQNENSNVQKCTELHDTQCNNVPNDQLLENLEINEKQQEMLDKDEEKITTQKNDELTKNIKFNENVDTIQENRDGELNRTTKDFNQTLSTTVSGRRKRKLYNPDDITFLETISVQQKSIVEQVDVDNVKKNDDLISFTNINRNDQQLKITDEIISKAPEYEIGLNETQKIQTQRRLNKNKQNNADILLKRVKQGKIVKAKKEKSKKNTNISYKDIKKITNFQEKSLKLKSNLHNQELYNRNNRDSYNKSLFVDLVDSFREQLGTNHNQKYTRKDSTKKLPIKKSTEKINSVKPRSSLTRKRNRTYLGMLINQEMQQNRSSSTSSSDFSLPKAISIHSDSSKKINIISNVRINPEFNSTKIVKRSKLCQNNKDISVCKEQANNDYESTYSAMVSEPAPYWETMALINEEFIWLKSDSFLGKYLVLFFYPLDFGFYPYVAAPNELAAFNRGINEFEKVNTAVVACSVDNCYTHLAWLKMKQEKENFGSLNFPLISDGSLKISKTFQIYAEKWGHTLRGFFIIDPQGTVMHQTVVDVGLTIDVSRVLKEVKNLQMSCNFNE